MDENYYDTLNDVMNKLNNGLSWSDIEKTNYNEIEKMRKEKATPSEFAKFLFRIRNNENLLKLSKRLPKIDLIYECFDSSPPHNKYRLKIIKNSNDNSIKTEKIYIQGHARDFDFLSRPKHSTLEYVPFLKKHIIKPPRTFYDC
ncbi:MAG: hypothetical protein CMF62_01040 [Magnetococcales bacterium]|nr:hypothetical protein [Magnetococcales bacterium]|tara:strand:+ start:41442 stop:41873 length:432 start_codon:yes stop_codon:yes gene_type:complete